MPVRAAPSRSVLFFTTRVGAPQQEAQDQRLKRVDRRGKEANDERPVETQGMHECDGVIGEETIAQRASGAFAESAGLELLP